MNLSAQLRRALSSEIADGNMSFMYGDGGEVVQNRERFLTKHNILLSQCIFPSLAHDDTIAVVNQVQAGSGAYERETAIRTEALITNDPNITLAVLTADCFPVSFFDPVQHVRALAHLGWKPATLHLAKKVVEKMIAVFGSKPSDIKVILGPGIHTASYVLKNPEQVDFAEWQPYLVADAITSGCYHIDLLRFIVDDVQAGGGVEEGNITVDPRDTAVTPSFFSHYRAVRASESEGRFLTIW